MDEIQMEFNNIIGELTDEEFKDYVWSWLDEQHYLDIMNNWDDDVKQDAIKELKGIISKRENKTFEVSLNFSQMIEAKTEEEAKEEMRKIFDSILLNLDCKEIVI